MKTKLALTLGWVVALAVAAVLVGAVADDLLSPASPTAYGQENLLNEN
jgi:hypothetical protein